MRSFAITLYDQCFRRHVVGQEVVNDVRAVRSRYSNEQVTGYKYFSNYVVVAEVFVACDLLIAVPGTSVLLHIT